MFWGNVGSNAGIIFLIFFFWKNAFHVMKKWKFLRVCVRYLLSNLFLISIYHTWNKNKREGRGNWKRYSYRSPLKQDISMHSNTIISQTEIKILSLFPESWIKSTATSYITSEWNVFECKSFFIQTDLFPISPYHSIPREEDVQGALIGKYLKEKNISLLSCLNVPVGSPFVLLSAINFFRL